MKLRPTTFFIALIMLALSFAYCLLASILCEDAHGEFAPPAGLTHSVQ